MESETECIWSRVRTTLRWILWSGMVEPMNQSIRKARHTSQQLQTDVAAILHKSTRICCWRCIAATPLPPRLPHPPHDMYKSTNHTHRPPLTTPRDAAQKYPWLALAWCAATRRSGPDSCQTAKIARSHRTAKARHMPSTHQQHLPRCCSQPVRIASTTHAHVQVVAARFASMCLATCCSRVQLFSKEVPPAPRHHQLSGFVRWDANLSLGYSATTIANLRRHPLLPHERD